MELTDKDGKFFHERRITPMEIRKALEIREFMKLAETGFTE